MKSLVLLFATLIFLPVMGAQTAAASPAAPASDARTQEIEEIRGELARLSARLDALERGGAPAATAATAAAAATAAPSAAPKAASGEGTGVASAAPASSSPSPGATASREAATPPQPSATPAALAVLPTQLPGGATLNYTLDGYYEYNFNQPPGRANDLRAYDVLSNAFSINQAALILDLDPDVESGRRYGVRVDLQYGQATDTLQGNPSNEARPTIYQNLFQAYGTYVFPVGRGLSVDFGKWASSLGIEGNYSKDQPNYTRSFYFYYLPFYHAGLRTSYHFNDKFAVNYWIVNGTDQSEPTNSFKDELFGFALTPTKNLSWTSNYYLGQDHPDAAPATNCTVPEQPGLCLQSINPAPNGKLHIFDNYVNWQIKPKLAAQVEGDYVIERTWADAAPGESSAPSHVDGGAGYLQYQWTQHGQLAARAEYLSDRGGLFSGVSQALKETTGTYKYTVGNGLDVFVEYRHDWTNVPYFRTQSSTFLSEHQTTAAVGLVWWYGGKQGNW